MELIECRWTVVEHLEWCFPFKSSNGVDWSSNMQLCNIQPKIWWVIQLENVIHKLCLICVDIFVPHIHFMWCSEAWGFMIILVSESTSKSFNTIFVLFLFFVIPQSANVRDPHVHSQPVEVIPALSPAPISILVMRSCKMTSRSVNWPTNGLSVRSWPKEIKLVWNRPYNTHSSSVHATLIESCLADLTGHSLQPVN